jgi:ABC-2 type transport system ATP-binding protein
MYSSALYKDEPLLQFIEVSKWFGPILALNQITWTFKSGIVGLVGANGAGKSTFLRLAAGLLRPTLGEVKIAGYNAWDWRSRRLIGYCPSTDAFFHDLSGQQFVSVMARLCGMTRREARKNTEAILQRLGLHDLATRPIYGYSKGMRQRIKLAQALVHHPPLLILDEPLAGIDPLGRHELIGLFRQLHQEGHSLIISSHELETLEQLTDQVLILSRGRVAAAGTIAEIRHQLSEHPITVRMAVSSPRDLARHLADWPEVSAIEWPASPQHTSCNTLLVRVHRPKEFFQRLTQFLAQNTSWDITCFEPIDESAHALLGYILGGSGKT